MTRVVNIKKTKRTLLSYVNTGHGTLSKVDKPVPGINIAFICDLAMSPAFPPPFFPNPVFPSQHHLE